jgi:protein-tyrosine phosphatase
MDDEVDMLNALRSYINDNYGSKRGLLASSKYYCLHRVGYLRELGEIDFSRVRKLIFVCSGNLCRSPLGEFYARHLGFDADSYGLNCRGGDTVDARVVTVAEKMGIQVASHVTKHIRHYQPAPDHLVVVMEPSHLEALPAEVFLAAQVTLASLWLREPRLYLHDPFSSNANYFHKCATNLMESLDRIGEYVHDQS